MRIGYAGRLIPGKGLDVLMRALATVRQEHDVSLLVAGDGPSRQELERLAGSLDLRDRVTFLGWTDDIGGFWSRCHLAVAPNDRTDESFCLSIAEAMSYSRPAVVTDRGALPELVIPEKTGVVVPAGDATALAGAIAYYALSPDRVSVHGRAAREHAERSYSLERCAERFLELAEALLVRRGSDGNNTAMGHVKG